MYCDPSRPFIKSHVVACFFGHVGDQIFRAQKWLGLLDWIGLQYAPYYPVFHLLQPMMLFCVIGIYLIGLPIADLWEPRTWRWNFRTNTRSLFGFMAIMALQCMFFSGLLALYVKYQPDDPSLRPLYMEEFRHLIDQQAFWE